MVIDDDVDTRLLMSAYLTLNLPASVRVDAIGDTAYREGGIDWTDVAVAVVDVMMPTVDGRVVLAELRDERPDVYRIAWTAAVDAVRDELVEQQLAHACIAKPGLDDLLAVLRPLLEQRG